MAKQLYTNGDRLSTVHCSTVITKSRNGSLCLLYVSSTLPWMQYGHKIKRSVTTVCRRTWRPSMPQRSLLFLGQRSPFIGASLWTLNEEWGVSNEDTPFLFDVKLGYISFLQFNYHNLAQLHNKRPHNILIWQLPKRCRRILIKPENGRFQCGIDGLWVLATDAARRTLSGQWGPNSHKAA